MPLIENIIHVCANSFLMTAKLYFYIYLNLIVFYLFFQSLPCHATSKCRHSMSYNDMTHKIFKNKNRDQTCATALGIDFKT